MTARDWRLLINQLAISALALVFFFAFNLFKHNPHFIPGAPFIEDPYDAIGSFVVVSMPFLLLLGWWRVLALLVKPAMDTARDFARNSQIAAAASVVVAAGADLLALGKAWFMGPWSSTHTQVFEIVALLFVVALLAATVVAQSSAAVRGWAWKDGAGSGALLCVLAIFPDPLIKVVWIHVLVLFVLIPLHYWAVAGFVEYFGLQPPQEDATPHTTRVYRWAMVLGLAFAVGGLIALSEWSEGAGLPGHLFRTILLLALFIFTAASCIAVGYAFLRKPLGL